MSRHRSRAGTMSKALENEVLATIVAVFACTAITACGAGSTSPKVESAAFPVLSGEYLGQRPPGAEPEVFAAGIVSTGLYERDLATTPDGMEIYFCVVLGNYDRSAIMMTRVEKGRWTEPEVASFSGRFDDLEPAIAPDGKKFYFISKRPHELGGAPRDDFDIWVMDRQGDGWGRPVALGEPVNSDGREYFPSVTSDGTLYFTRDTEGGGSTIFRSRLIDGDYQQPAPLGPQVNSVGAQFNSYVAPDESFLIFGAAGREDSVGGVDYFISFREDDDTWLGPINLGRAINTESNLEYSPYVTPDGKYFFFMAARSRWNDGTLGAALSHDMIRQVTGGAGNGLPDIWWVDAAFLDELRP